MSAAALDLNVTSMMQLSDNQRLVSAVVNNLSSVAWPIGHGRANLTLLQPDGRRFNRPLTNEAPQSKYL
jgi:hypothetical protein